jgi:hypothetical protein
MGSPITSSVINVECGGNLGLNELCKKLVCFNHVDEVIAAAAGGCHEAIVRWCHDEGGATDVSSAITEAAKGGHEAIVRLCLDEWGASKGNCQPATPDKH